MILVRFHCKQPASLRICTRMLSSISWPKSASLSELFIHAIGASEFVFLASVLGFVKVNHLFVSPLVHRHGK